MEGKVLAEKASASNQLAGKHGTRGNLHRGKGQLEHQAMSKDMEAMETV